jgi:hypothetical protein
LSHLYTITDKDGQRTIFRPNTVQRRMLAAMHHRNVVLKARQHGISTLACLLGLDTCIFRPNTQVGIIAHHIDDAAELFRTKIKEPYEALPAALRAQVRADRDRANQLVFSNGSSIRVATSMRSGTVQMLHVSEMGKIAVLYPQKAREIMSGALEAVGRDGVVTVESTAEGAAGAFYDLVRMARHTDRGQELGPLEWRFHFFAWFEEPGYRDSNPVQLTEEQARYFDSLQHEHGIKLDAQQQAWYVRKAAVLGEDMRREYPSTPDEAFQAAVLGAYYERQLLDMRKEQRIGIVPHDRYAPVYTGWDLGMDDATVIWFYQEVGQQKRLIDYYENSGEGLDHYAQALRDKQNQLGYNYMLHYLPHDSGNRSVLTTGDMAGKTALDIMRALGFPNTAPVRRPRNPEEFTDQIENVRKLLGTVWVDESRCAAGIEKLSRYRKTPDDVHGGFKPRPVHDDASHPADALRTLAVGHRAAVDEPLTFEPEPDY